MKDRKRVSATKRMTHQIDAIHSTLGPEAAITQIRKLADMKMRSEIPDVDHFQREELIDDCLLIACNGKFRGVSKDGEPVQFSSWVYRIIDNKINNAIRARISKRKRESVRQKVRDISLLGDKDRQLAHEVFSLREQGMTYKEVARKLNASGVQAKKINHVALRKRVSRLQKKMEVLPEGNSARYVKVGTKLCIPYAE